MGICQSNSLDPGLEGFRRSVLGSFFNFSYELLEFYNLAQHQRQMTSSALVVSPDVAFYVVVAGEVVAYASTESNKLIAAAVFKPGDLIYFLPNLNIRNGSVVCNKVRLTYQLCSTEGVSSVGGAHLLAFSRQDIWNFVSTRPHLSKIAQLVDPQVDILSGFLSLPGFKKLTLAHVQLLVCLMSLHRAVSGQVVKTHDPSSRSYNDHAHSFSSDRSCKAARLLTPMLSERDMGLLLTGSCAHIPDVADLVETVQQVAEAAEPRNPSERRGSISKVLTNLYSVNSIQTCIELDGSLKRNQIYPGSVFGFEHFFIQNNLAVMDNILSLEDSWVGSLSRDTLKVLFNIDAPMKYYLRKNYYSRVLDSVRELLPVLHDMDEELYESLCSKVTLKCYNQGDKIYTKGQHAKYAYIVVHGMVKKFDFDSAGQQDDLEDLDEDKAQPLSPGLSDNLQSILRSHRSHTSPSDPAPTSPDTSTRFLGIGSLFGEVSLVTDSPYFSSSTAMERTIVVCISRKSLDLVYNKDKTKLAELRMRLACGAGVNAADATDVGIGLDLEHVLLHPQANNLFHTFCEKEHNSENVTFYNAVMQYEEMFEMIMYNILHTIPIPYWQRLQEHNQFILDALTPPAASPLASPRNNRVKAPSMSHIMRNAQSSRSLLIDPHPPAIISSGASPRAVIIKRINTQRNLQGMTPSTSVSDFTPTEAHVDDLDMPVTTRVVLKNMPSSTSMISANSMRSISRQSTMNSTLLAYTLAQQGDVDTEHSMRLGMGVGGNADGSSSVKDIRKNIYFNNLNHFSGRIADMPAKSSIGNSVCASTADEPAATTAADSDGIIDDCFLLESYTNIVKQIIELQEVATNIMDKYIYEGCTCEVNIPASIRHNTITMYKQFISRPQAVSIGKILHTMVEKYVHQREETSVRASNKPSTPSHKPQHTVSHTQTQEVAGNLIFSLAMQEIFKLMKIDAYARFKHTSEFSSFITALIKPFNNQENVRSSSTYIPSSPGRDKDGSTRRSLMCASEESMGSGYALGHNTSIHGYNNTSIHGYNNTPNRSRPSQGSNKHTGGSSLYHVEEEEVMGRLAATKRGTVGGSKRGMWMSFQRNLSSVLPIDA